MSQETLTLLTTIGTFVAALATFLTVLEMRWQRHTTFRPDLIVESTGFEVYPDGVQNFGLISVDRKRPSSEAPRDVASLRVRNAGFGPAKNVVFAWEVDIQAFLELIGTVDPTLIESAEYDAGRRLRLFDAAKRESTHNLLNQLGGRLPTLMADGSAAIVLPLAYLHLLLLSLNAMAKRETELMRSAVDPADRHLFDMGSFRGWPPLTLRLSCKDLGGYQHRKAHTVQPEVAMLRFGAVDDIVSSANILVSVSD